jgi:nucleoside 2-deoxyribosyltransferase
LQKDPGVAAQGRVGMTKKIYLCGPIMDCDDSITKDWRTRAKERLAGRFVLLDPMRRNFRDNEIDSSNEIVEFDLQDIRDADIVLVNYSKASVGTSMEVFYASHDLGKFVVAFSPFTFKDCSPWMVRFTTKILPCLDDAITYIERHF